MLEVMTMQQNTPNAEQSNRGTLAGGLKEFLDNYMRNDFSDCLPATVVSYDRTTNRAVLQPLVMMVSTGGDKISRGTVANIPVFRFGCGQFFISMPLKTGDFGWIKSNDKDVSLVMQSGSVNAPNTKRIHSFSDAMFFPHALAGWLISGENADAMVLQNTSGTVSISLHEDRVLIEAPTIEQRGEHLITGNVTVTGNVSTTGTMTNNGKDVGSTHYHAGSTPDKVPV